MTCVYDGMEYVYDENARMSVGKEYILVPQ